METRGKPVEVLAYVAGVMDSDGCVSISRASPKMGTHSIVYPARVTVTNTDHGLIFWLKDEFGGFIHQRAKWRENHKTTYSWVISDRQAASFLAMILPYMRVKKEQARLLIELKEGIGPTNHRGPWYNPRLDTDEVVRRERIYLEIRALNDDRRPHRLSGVASRTEQATVSANGKPLEVGGTETTHPLPE